MKNAQAPLDTAQTLPAWARVQQDQEGGQWAGSVSENGKDSGPKPL